MPSLWVMEHKRAWVMSFRWPPIVSMLDFFLEEWKILEGSKIHDITWAKGLEKASFIIAIYLEPWSTPLKEKRLLDSPVVISLDPFPFPSIISITSLSTHEFLTHRYLKLWDCVIVANSQALMLLILLNSCGVHTKNSFLFFYFFQWATLIGPLQKKFLEIWPN